MATPFKWRRRRGGAGVIQSHSLNRRIRVFFTRKYVFRYILSILAVIAILPPVYFHFSLRRFHQLELKRCSWLNNPPLVCAHGGDSSKAFPNTMAAYDIALRSQVDCIEIDVSRSADGVLLALHDRDLQRLSRNNSSKVGYLSAKEIQEVGASHNITIPTMEDALQIQELGASHNITIPTMEDALQIQELGASHNITIPTMEDALQSITSFVQKVVVDAKIGPPSYEKGLAHDLISVVKKTQCQNCVIWAKSDNLVLDVALQSSDMTVGYIVMMNYSTGVRTKLLRMRAADVVGIYHGLVDESVIKILHRRKKKVYAWTVDDEAAMHKILNENVDAIITSDPSLLQSSMRDIRKKCLVDGFSIQQS